MTAGLLVSQINESPLNLIYARGAKGAFSHGESLKQFKIKDVSIGESEINIESLNARAFRWLSRSGVATSYLPYYEQSELGFSEEIYKLRKNVTLLGYFQSYRYLEQFSKLNKDGLTVEPQVFSRTLKNFLRQIEFTDPIALHVRRGDYVGNKSTGLLSDQYYREALDILASKDREVWVFSDDIQEARKLLLKMSCPNWKWIDSSNLDSSTQTLYAMSMCSDIIIANSTFSWWAANLNRKSGVVAPKKWFANQTDPIDLIPEQWHRVNSNWV